MLCRSTMASRNRAASVLAVITSRRARGDCWSASEAARRTTRLWFVDKIGRYKNLFSDFIQIVLQNILKLRIITLDLSGEQHLCSIGCYGGDNIDKVQETIMVWNEVQIVRLLLKSGSLLGHKRFC